MDAVERITRTCLYEGYLLWPYRRSTLKNQQRWTFGGIYPQCCAGTIGEASVMETQCLLEAAPDTDLAVSLRFLHLVDRTVLRLGPGGPEPVDSLTVDGRRHLSWQEATERRTTLPPAAATALLAGGRTTRIAVPGGSDREPLTDRRGRTVGLVRRTWQPLTGIVGTRAERVDDGTLRLAVRITNTTACPPPAQPDTGPAGTRRISTGQARDRVARHALLSAHTVLHSDRGRFASLTDPPERLRGAAQACRNQGTWPVLVGDDDTQPAADGSFGHTVLSSPITLCDYPRVAPESPGDLFDGTEIDQLLILSVLSMTPQERAEMAADPRGRDILERCSALTPEDLMALHGTIRSMRPLEDV